MKGKKEKATTYRILKNPASSKMKYATWQTASAYGRGKYAAWTNPATCIADCAFLLVIISWLNIKPGFVKWLSFLIAPDGIITNRIVILIIISLIFFDTVFYYVVFCCLYYIFVYFIFECNFIFPRNFYIFLMVLQYFFLYLKGTTKLHATCFKYINGNFLIFISPLIYLG